MILDGDKLDVFNAPIARRKLGITGGAGGVAVSAGANSQSSGTISFSNANGVSFGLDGVGVLTASVAAGGGITNINISAGTTSQNLSAFTFNNSNGVSFGLDAAASIVTATVATNYQSQGAYLTTAMQSNAVTLSNINVSAGTTSSNVSAVTFSNGNGVSFGFDGSNISATVKTNYLTTAMASDRGSDFVQATAAFAGTNASGTINSTGISVSVAAAAVQSTQPVAASASNGSFLFSTVAFSNANNVTFGTSAGSIITASVATNYQSQGAYLTTAMESDAGSRFVNTSAGLNLTNISATFGSNSISLSVAAAGAASLNFSAGTTSGNIDSVIFSNANGVSFGLNGSTITATVATNYQSQGAYLTTAMVSDAGSRFVNTSADLNLTNISATFNSNSISLSVAAQSVQPVAASASNGSFLFSTISFSNANGISFSTVAGSAISASYTVPTQSVQPVAASASNGSFTFATVGFSNANGVTFGTSAGSIVSASVATNYQSQGAYLTTAMASDRGSDFVQATAAFAGTNASGTINSTGISVSVAAPSAATISYLNLAPFWFNTATTEFAQSTSYMIPFVLPQAISIGSVRLFEAGSVAASSTQGLVNGSTLSMSGQTSHNFVFYSRGVGASSQSLQFVQSTQVVDAVSMNVQNAAGANSSRLSYTLRFSIGNTSFTKDYSSTAQSYNYHTSQLTDLTGTKQVDYPCGLTLSAGQWFLGYGRSTTFATQNAVISVATRLVISYNTRFVATQNTLGALGTLGGASNSSVAFAPMGLGSFTTGGAAGTTASLNESVISSGVSNQMPLFQLVRIA